MNVKESKKFYRWCHRYLGPIVLIFRPMNVIGRENMADGAAIICANHSAMIDPFHVALAYDANIHVHVLAKKELYKIPIISILLKKVGMIIVDRSKTDPGSIKASLGYLKKGEKVLIFPEGTRMTEHDATTAKNGAVRLAERAGVPIQPVYIPRKKPFFKKSVIVFGKPYVIERKKEKRLPDEYTQLSQDLMNRINALEPANP